MDRDLEIEFGIGEVVPTSKTVQGVQIPLLKLDDPFFQLEQSDPKAGVAIEREMFMQDVVGPHDSDDPIHELSKLSKNDLTVEILAKSGNAGKALAKAINKAGGVVSDGMRAMYELFFDKFHAEERKLAEKAIKMVDVAAFHQLMMNVFQRA